MDFLNDYLGEIIVALGISFILGIVGAIRAFFVGIKRMDAKLQELEDKLAHNVNSDAEVKEWVKKLIEQKMKNNR